MGNRWSMAVTDPNGTVTFWWHISSGEGDEVNFYIDGVWQSGRSGLSSWNEVSRTISTAGVHTLRWRYSKDSSGSAGSDCAWVDYVHWTGSVPEPNGGLINIGVYGGTTEASKSNL